MNDRYYSRVEKNYLHGSVVGSGWVHPVGELEDRMLAVDNMRSSPTENLRQGSI